MGRKRQFTNEVLDEYYSIIHQVIVVANRPISGAELVQVTGLNIGQIAKAVQYKRRQFDNGTIPITDLIIASPNGYFLPSYGREVVAYGLQHYKDIMSRVRTFSPIIKYAKDHWPEAWDTAVEILDNNYDPDAINDEVTPWEIYEQIMKGAN